MRTRSPSAVHPDRSRPGHRGRAQVDLLLDVRPYTKLNERAQSFLQHILLLTDPPAGVKVSLEDRPGGAESWLYEPAGPAFKAADRAYEKSWGKPLAQIGIGGSIPFVALFGRKYAHLPLILNGVMDPLTGAHGPNESLHLGVFEKAIVANVYLYDELSRVG